MADNVWTAETYGERWTWIYDRLGRPQPDADHRFVSAVTFGAPPLPAPVRAFLAA